MKRLTYKTNGRYINTAVEQAAPYAIDCDIDTAITKLAEYEDLEITPEQIREIDRLYAEKCRELAECREDYLTGKELAEIATEMVVLRQYRYLKAAGRLVKLPCAVGDTVYTNHSMKGWHFRESGRPYAAEVVFIGINSTGSFINVEIGAGHMMQFQISDLGKRFFLTREEAEAALEEMSGADE